MKVSALIKKLKMMPQDLEVGYTLHDYDCGDSENINSVTLLDDNEIANDSGIANHNVVLGG